MFSSLKLNSLKCQSNGDSEKKKDKCEGGDEEEDDLSDHMYEKLPNSDNKPCKCHTNYITRSPKSQKLPFTRRISKWRMECPIITNVRVSRPGVDRESKNNQEETNGDLTIVKHQQNVRSKVTTVNIKREDGNLGITLRGGFHQNVELSKPVTITYVKPDGPAAKEGTIKAGDRLLAVDGVSLQGACLTDAQTLLKQQSASTLLTIEYDVNVLDTVEHANGPLLVEIERTSDHELGVILFQNENGIVVERVKPASLADRCGALHVGDEILAVNNTRIDSSLVAEDVVKLLECDCPIIRLEILPSYAVVSYSSYEAWRNRENIITPSSSLSGVSTLKSHASRKIREFQNGEPPHENEKIRSNLTNATGYYGSNIALTHSESLHTTICRDNGSFGLQLADSQNESVVIHSITPGGPAERSQCLHPGDRVISINHRSIALDNLTAKDLNEILDGKTNDVPCNKLSLHTEFDVLDTVVPASGVFTVKLAKRGTTGLGITITASKTAGFTVCEMKKGSIAYRAGSLIPGDKLLAINNIPLDQCSVEYAAHILHQSTDIVILKVQRLENHQDLKNHRKVIYTVELQRYGGPLGITIAGSEEPFQPITVSGLTAGGLAEETGVLHIGDEILAINNHSLYGEPLSKAHALLQDSSDLVTLKICRSILPYSRGPSNRSPILPSSIDSAVESWDSSHLDLTPSPDHSKNIRDSRDPIKRNFNLLQQWTTNNSTYMNSFNGNSTHTPLDENNPDLALLDEISNENLKIKQELDMLSIKLDEQCKSNANSENANGENSTNDQSEDCSTLKTSDHPDLLTLKDSHELENNFNKGERESFITNDFENFEMSYLPEARNWFKTPYLGNDNNQGSIRSEFQSSQLIKVTLYKDSIYEDFGFSVSDGLYERGVFINRIRKGGPADLSGVLKPYDRILQVNDTYTQDFDCCLTVPLIASAGDSLELLVARNAGSYAADNIHFDNEKSIRKEIISSKIGINGRDLDEPQRILV